MPHPPRRHKTVHADGYDLTFYPGFLRTAAVRAAQEGEVVLYEQTEPYDIRQHPDEPLTRFMLRLQGGPNRRSVTLRVDDPEHAVAEIVVRFHPRGYRPGGRKAGPPDESVTFENDATYCPPVCREPTEEPRRKPRTPRKRRD